MALYGNFRLAATVSGRSGTEGYEPTPVRGSRYCIMNIVEGIKTDFEQASPGVQRNCSAAMYGTFL